MKNINKLAKAIAKVLEVVHWVGAGLMACVAVCAIAAPGQLRHFMDLDGVTVSSGDALSVYGFELTSSEPGALVDMKALFLFALGSVFIFILLAMVFRNIYLIVKKSDGASPFQKDNIRMIREIGIFSIAIPVLGLIISTIGFLVLNAEYVEIKVDLTGLVMGIIVLYLTQVFAYGARLENDVDGLV